MARKIIEDLKKTADNTCAFGERLTKVEKYLEAAICFYTYLNVFPKNDKVHKLLGKCLGKLDSTEWKEYEEFVNKKGKVGIKIKKKKRRVLKKQIEYFECAKCGGTVTNEDKGCPHCGIEFCNI